ncbi:MAG: hypothetical protein KBT12_09365, partial [Bacteroidales bacterium]|nr:hypothetical protein [Candidatus Physcousia equi]
MKKLIYTALLALGFLGAQAEEAKLITTEASAVSAATALSHAQLKELFNTGKHFAFVNTNNSARGWNTFGAVRSNELTTDQLYTVTTGSADGRWHVKNYAGATITQAKTNVIFGDAAQGFDWLIPQDGTSSITAGGITYEADRQFRFQNVSAENYRVEYKDFGNFAGDWARYVAYGPFYVVSVEAKSGEQVLGTYTGAICTQGKLTVAAPDIEGYLPTVATQEVEVTDDATITIQYTPYASGDPSKVNLTPWPSAMRVFDGMFTLPDAYTISLAGITTQSVKDSTSNEVARFIAQMQLTTDKKGVVAETNSGNTRAEADATITLTENAVLGDEAY